MFLLSASTYRGAKTAPEEVSFLTPVTHTYAQMSDMFMALDVRCAVIDSQLSHAR